MIEQLHYTWARAGLQGLGRFQVTATSPGLVDLQSPLAALALRLCRYSDNRGLGHSSYGWIDARGHRFVFRRVPAGHDALGRPGNFVAHVMVMPVSAVDPIRLLQPGAPGLWWDGATETEPAVALPVVAPQPLGPPLLQVTSDADARVATAHLLDRGFAGEIPVAGDGLLAALYACAASLPAAIHELRGMSTFEESEPIGWFPLVGTVPRDFGVGRPAPPRSLEAADLILSTAPGDVRRRNAVARVAHRPTGWDWQSFGHLASVFSTIEGGATPSADALASAMENAGTAEELLLDSRARAAVCDGLLHQVPAIVRAALTGLSNVQVELLEELGRELAMADEAKAFVRIAPLLATLPNQVQRGVAEHALGLLREHDADNVPLDILSAMGRLHNLTPDQELQVLSPLIARAETLIYDRSIPAQRRMVLVRMAIDAGALRTKDVAIAVRKEPLLARALLPELAQLGLIDSVLRHMTRVDAAERLIEAAPSMSSETLEAIGSWLVPELSLEDARVMYMELKRFIRRGTGGVWANMSNLMLMRSLSSELAGTEPLRPLRSATFCWPTAPGKAWGTLLAHLAGVGRPASARQLKKTQSLLQADCFTTDPSPLSYALQAHASSWEHYGDVDLSVRALVGNVRDDHLLDLLNGARRQLTAGFDRNSCVAVISYIAQTQPVSKLVRKEVEGLAERLDEAAWQRLEDVGPGLEPSAARLIAALRPRPLFGLLGGKRRA